MKRLTLGLFVTTEEKNSIDPNRTLLNVKFGVLTEDGKTRAKMKKQPFFSNSTLHTSFSHTEMFLNGELISHSKNCYLPAPSVETELMTDREGRETWANCQG